MSCIYGGASCGLPGRFSSECWSFWGSEEKMGDFRCWIESYSWRVSFCFVSLYIADILYNLIQGSLWSLFLALLLLKIDTLLTPCATFLFRFHYHYPFHWHAWQIGGNTWGVKSFKISLSPHQHLTALITLCKWPKGELLFRGRPWPPSTSAGGTIKDSFSLLR